MTEPAFPRNQRAPVGIMVILLVGVATGCDRQLASPAREQTVFALRDNVGFHAGSSAVVKSLRYGQSVRVQRCDTDVCYAMVDGTLATIARSDVADAPPPKGSRYLWRQAPGLKPNQRVAIQGYDPRTNSFQVDGGSWVSEKSLADRPETAGETRAREKAERVTKAKQAKEQREEARRKIQRQREEAKEERERLRLEAIATTEERRAFAKTLRDRYLASGADIKVSVSGKYAQRLTLEYPLINEVLLYQFQHREDVIDALRAKGFTQVDLSNGWDYAKRLTL